MNNRRTKDFDRNFFDIFELFWLEPAPATAPQPLSPTVTSHKKNNTHAFFSLFAVSLYIRGLLPLLMAQLDAAVVVFDIVDNLLRDGFP